MTGASSSYARKYALNGLFAIDDTKDSDTTSKCGTDGLDEKLVGEASKLGISITNVARYYKIDTSKVTDELLKQAIELKKPKIVEKEI